MSYGYNKNDKYRQKRKICTKNYARKRCVPNWLNIKHITKYNKNLRLHFLQMTTIVIQMTPNILIIRKENQNLQKWGKYTKISKIGFMKTGCSKKKDHLRKIKPLWRAHCISIDIWYELYKEILSYNLTEIKLADLKNLSLFLNKNKYFQNS